VKIELLLCFESGKIRAVWPISKTCSKTVFMKNGFAPKDYIKAIHSEERKGEHGRA